MKENRFFSELSVSKLQKMAYNMEQMNLCKNQVLYREDQKADGIYLVIEGSVKYSKVVDYKAPIESKTTNRWFT